MGTILCDVIMTLKRHEKKMETSFFLNRIYFSTGKCMFPAFSKNLPWDFTAACTNNLIKEKLLDLIEWIFKRAIKTMVHFIWHVMTERLFFTSSDQSRYTLWSCQNVCDALSYLLDNIYIRFGTKLYRQIVGIPMDTNCAPLVADLFLYCYERDFMDSLNHDNQADVIEAFNSTSRYLDDLLNIDNPYFEGMVNQIYPPEQ